MALTEMTDISLFLIFEIKFEVSTSIETENVIVYRKDLKLKIWLVCYDKLNELFKLLVRKNPYIHFSIHV